MRAAELALRFLGLLAESLELLRGSLGVRLGRLKLARRDARLRLGLGRSILQRFEPAALDEPRRCGCRHAGLEPIAVPAPAVAFLGNEPLPRLKLRLEGLAAFLIDDADLRKAAS